MLQLRLADDEIAEFVERFERDGTPFEEQDDVGILAEQELVRQSPPKITHPRRPLL